jgi:hypothetical protein
MDMESGCESGYCPEEGGVHLCRTLTVIFRSILRQHHIARSFG